MQGLKLTFETLAKTRNEAAIDVLISALDDDNDNNRRFALNSLLARNEPRTPKMVLAAWPKLLPDDLRILKTKKSWICRTVGAALKSGSDEVMTAIDAAESLELTDVLPHLVLLAESSASRAVKMRATEAVLKMVAPLGSSARADRDQPTVRGPVIARLADSVRRFSMHRNEDLVDAFLIVSTWGDGDLRQMITDGPEDELLFKRLAESSHPCVIELLAGALRRRNNHERVSQILQSRTDEAFRDALLRKIGAEPSATVLRNLREIGTPRSCRGGEELLGSVAPDYRCPLIHLYVAAENDCLETLNVICGAVERADGCAAAAAFGLSRVEIPEVDFWMRAAVPVADGNAEAISNDENARLLKRLIDLLDHPDPSLVRGVRRVLGPLHAGEMLHRFESLRPRSRRRLGRVVMMIDPDAIQRVRDALRHPVLNHRLEAIATADALAIVDLLSDSFQHIAREDHQEARIRAAEVMSEATGSTTLDLLREMINLPECPVRDAAMEAIQRREKADAR